MTNSLTFFEIFQRSMSASRHNLKPSTIRGYQYLFNSHIGPTFGEREIDSIHSSEVEAWMLSLYEKKSSRTGKLNGQQLARSALVLVSRTFNYAYRHNLISENPCHRIEWPRVPRPIPTFITAAEVERLAVDLDQFPPYGLIVRFAAYTGLRAGEFAALQIGNLDFERGLVEVRKTAILHGREWTYQKPKSQSGVRDVPLNETLTGRLLEYLSAHPHRNDAEAMLWPKRSGDRTPYAKPMVDYTAQFNPSAVYSSHVIRAVRRQALHGTTWHTLRHTYASLMAAAGVSILKVSRWMGHGSVEVTDRTYTHLFRGDHQAEMSQFDRYLADQVVREDA